MHKVLVNPGSAADLLHLPTFQQMKVPLDRLSLAYRVLFGFNRATTLTVGNIVLSIKARLITQKVLLSVVDDLGPYIAIVGRAWLHAMKAIP